MIEQKFLESIQKNPNSDYRIMLFVKWERDSEEVSLEELEERGTDFLTRENMKQLENFVNENKGFIYNRAPIAGAIQVRLKGTHLLALLNQPYMQSIEYLTKPDPFRAARK